MSRHSKSNSDVQLKNKLNIVISKKVCKLNLEKQLIFGKAIIKIMLNSIVMRRKLLQQIIRTTCNHSQKKIK